MGAAIRVAELRGGVVESEHEVEGVVVDAAGRVLAATARPDLVTFFRSSAKPMQAVPLVERGHADQLGLTDRELAVMCASHNGEPSHVAAAREILARTGAQESDLECGFHFPEDAETADRLRASNASERSPIYNNCSGKHAGMIALAVAEGWPVRGYTDPGHPVQELLVRTVCEICDVDPARAPLGIDGCSASNPALSLLSMARGFATIAAARSDGATARERALARVRDAMVLHPDMVAGRNRFCTAFMTATRGRMMTKTGAEGVQCVSVTGRGLGISVKARDGGARRATAPALVGWMQELGLLDATEAAALAPYARPSISNHRGLVTGTLEAGGFPAWRPETETAAIGSGGVH